MLLVCLCLFITVFGGYGPIPTWNEIYNFFGVGNASPAPDTATQGETRVHFIDVGQGDAVLIESAGEYILIDCGTEDCEEQLLGYLDQLGVTRLSLLVMTHPHADHIGSMDAVLYHLPVDTLLLPDLENAAKFPTTATFERVLTAAEQNGCAVQQGTVGQTFAVGEGVLTVFSTGVYSDDYNNISLGTRFTVGSFSYVSTGDAEAEVEQQMLQNGVQPATLFKAAHHGSNTSNTAEFLAELYPVVIVVSCGEGNSYGHPHKEPMERYEAIDAYVYRTDLNGSVVVSYSPDEGLQVYTSK